MGESHLRASCAALLLAAAAGIPSGALAQPAPDAPAAAQQARFAGSTHDTASSPQAGRSADDIYKLLAPLEAQYAGDVDYDYRLGTSALDSGRISQSIFALQRAVAARPGFAGARMELARAYFAQGDNESARREFQTLEKQQPPPQAQRAIADYLDAIDRRASAYERQLSGYAELASGFDTNANGAPDIQSFIGIPLDSRNQSTSSSYYNLGAGGLVSHPFATGWRLIGTGSVGYRGNPDASFVDSQVLQLAGGVDWRPGRLELSLKPNFALAMLDGEDNQQVAGLDASGTWHTSDRAQLSLNLRSGQTRYAEGLEVLDVDTFVFGIAATFIPRSLPRLQLFSAATLGSDDAVEPGSPYGRDISGGRIGATMAFGRGHTLLAALSSVSSDYDGQFFVPARREDDQLGVTLGYEWGGWRTRGMSLRVQLNYTDNSSTVELYDYDRIDAGVSLRKEFK